MSTRPAYPYCPYRSRHQSRPGACARDVRRPKPVDPAAQRLQHHVLHGHRPLPRGHRIPHRASSATWDLQPPLEQSDHELPTPLQPRLAAQSQCGKNAGERSRQTEIGAKHTVVLRERRGRVRDSRQSVRRVRQRNEATGGVPGADGRILRAHRTRVLSGRPPPAALPRRAAPSFVSQALRSRHVRDVLTESHTKDVLEVLLAENRHDRRGR